MSARAESAAGRLRTVLAEPGVLVMPGCYDALTARRRRDTPAIEWLPGPC